MRSKRPGRRARFSAMLSAILMSSCATTDIGVRTEAARVACAAFQPIRWSARDTADTVAQVKEHNAAYRALCAGK